MRRLVAVFILGVVLLTGVIAAAQPDIPPFIPIEPIPQESFTYTVPLEPATWEEVVAQLPMAPQAPAPSDSCSAAPSLNLSLPADGGQAVVNSYSEAATDPILNCMWGTPSRPQGYRTAWYKLIAPTSGLLVVEALPNADYRDNYDTVIAIHTGTCASLNTVSCVDDSNGFLSRATALIQQDVTYYIEVADWQFGVNGTARINLLAYITAADSFWKYAGNIPVALTRHTATRIGSDFYIIGGLRSTGNTPDRIPTVRKYDTISMQWSTLAPMPSVPSTCMDGFGYAATDAAYIDGRIFTPSGYTGNNNAFCGVHMVYDVATNSWSTDTAAPWPAPLGWTQAVAYPDLNGYFVVGGLTGAPLTTNANPSKDLYFFVAGTPPTPGTWQTLPQMNKARYGHTAALMGNNVCVMGGINEDMEIIPDGECFNISNNQWTTIPPLNYPRFNAGSAVDQDGRWYVFGGTNASLASIAQVELFNGTSWQVLDARYNLGTVNGLDRPARSWVRGDFVGRFLWVFGGEQDIGVFNAGLPLRLIEQLRLDAFWPNQVLMPVVRNSPAPNGEPNNTIAQAQPHPTHVTLAHNFEDANDYHDIFTFSLNQPSAVRFYLQNIPTGADYDMLLYDDDKTFKASSRNVGTLDEYIEQGLPAGKYYVIVVRAYPVSTPPPTDYYTLRIENY